MDGRVFEGRFIEPESYAAFLRGVLAEEAGQLPEALRAFAAAAALDDRDPLVATRLGGVLCRMDPKDPRAEEAFARALRIDASFEPALDARARCARARGDDGAAAATAMLAVAADPLALSPEVMLAEVEVARTRAEAARDRLVALSLLQGTSVVAWDALAAWGVAHHDAMLVARALGAVARLAPSRKAELADRAVGLAGDGELFAARTLAAALLDAPGDRSSGGEGPAPAAIPLVARLAVDEALARHDGARAALRATRAHLGLDVVAGRALLMGDAALARELAEPVVRADPRAKGVRMVLATAAFRLGEGDLVTRALEMPRSDPAPLPAEAMLPFAELLQRVSSAEAARRMLEAASPIALLAGDALVTPLAVELAAQGVLADEALPADARLELAARRSEVLPAEGAPAASMDARHLLFAWALERPTERATLELARRLAPAADHDALVAVAMARLSLAEGRALSPAALDQLLAVNPADPIVAAAALDLAKRAGDVRAIAPLRARLTALARTPGERAHALE
jgi:Tfp pilus assembly protein PilF